MSLTWLEAIMNPTPPPCAQLRVLGFTFLLGSVLAVPLPGGESEPIFVIERTVHSMEEAKEVASFRPEASLLMEKIQGRAGLLFQAENDDLQALAWVDAEGVLYLYAQWKSPHPASERLSFSADFLNERLRRWNVEDSGEDNAPLREPRSEKQPVLTSTVARANLLPGLSHMSDSVGFGFECYQMRPPPEKARFVVLSVKFKDPLAPKWKTELSFTLPISQWKPWDGGDAR